MSEPIATAGGTKTMTAVVQERYGTEPEAVLRTARLVRPVSGVRRPKLPNPGRSVAGVVGVVGSDVTGFAPGDEVYGTAVAAFADYAATRPERIAPRPAGLTFEEAATVPVSALTSLQAVRDHGKVEEGQQVLITGAAGGVGTFAVQLAHATGARVTAVASTPKLCAVRALGADHVIDYTREDFLAGPRRYDAIIDTTPSSTSRATAVFGICAARSHPAAG
ncbi:NAD(P)-dependent alcohol dehydrogenase [Streptomyces odonnellii]|uniref:NAD(P)-dependent alcohol dehydrogenase n=1 Tax=Streptomyces odonnellii TaxID=1417980 RepID=UPI0006968AF5|nr:NAD(P)-dependent alcohol dehydrogenase [Streptomyces odonnellii]